MNPMDGGHRRFVTVKLSDATMALIRANATLNFNQTGTKVGDWWEVPLDRKTLSRLMAHGMIGETTDETIFRALSTLRGRH
jgi:hypothetical protein